MIRFDKTTPLGSNIHYFLKWTFISCVIGLTVGVIGALFGIAVRWVTSFWETHSWTLFLAPVAGVLIVWLYKPFTRRETGAPTWCWRAFPPARTSPWPRRL